MLQCILYVRSSIGAMSKKFFFFTHGPNRASYVCNFSNLYTIFMF